MARRKSRRATATVLKGARRLHMETAEVEVDDPYATKPGEKIRVQRQLRSDPLARLHSHRQIDDVQFRAGRNYQDDCEKAARGIRSIDLSHERFDGGTLAEPLTDVQIRARKRLGDMERVLGRTMHRVTQAVLVDGMNMETIAVDLFGRGGEVSTKYYGRMFRDALDVLAGEYGLAGR